MNLHTVTKTLYISISAILVLLVIDFMTFRNQDLSDSLVLVKQYTESNFNNYKDKLLGDPWLGLLNADSLTSQDLEKINHLQEELAGSKLEARLFLKNKALFWTKKNDPNSSICKSYKKNDYKLTLCQEIFNTEGKLLPVFYKKTRLSNSIMRSTESDESAEQWDNLWLKSIGKYRSSRINNLLLLFYSILFTILVWQLIKIGNVLSLSILFFVRLSLLYFDSWHLRFANSDLISQLFDWRSYSNIDLIADMILLFGILIYVSRNISHFNFRKNTRLLMGSHALLLILLIASHVKLIKHTALCDSFNVTINDISSINVPEILTLLALVLGLTSIFIYTVSFTQELKSKFQKNAFYLALMSCILLTAGLIEFMAINVQFLYSLLFLSCYFILIDLFIDIKQKSITWIIWWAIFFGIYMSALFFNYDIQKQIDQRSTFMHALLDDNLDSLKQNTAVIDTVLNELNQLIKIPEDEDEFNIDDIEFYFNQKYGSYNAKVDLVNRYSNSSLNNWDEDGLYIELDSTRYFDPVRDYLWKKRNLSDSLNIYAGIQIASSEQPSFPFCIYDGNRFFYFGLTPNENEKALLLNMKPTLLMADSKAYLKHQNNGLTIFCTNRFESIVKPIALFSLLFSIIIVLFVLVAIANKYLKIMPPEWPLNLSQFESLNARIQLALILVILLSFIFIAAVTSSFLSSFIDSKNNKFLEEKLEVIARDLSKKLKLASSGNEAYVIANNYKKVLEDTHQTQLSFHNLNAPDLNGNYFNYAYFKKYPTALAFTDKKGKNEYNSYLPISFKGKRIAYIEMREFSESVKSFNLYDFLGSIFNVYVFLFLIASVLAILIASTITKPLSLLNQKLASFKLGKRNELISWDREDEVGQLINNYNNLVRQLENSAQLLAKTERDNAWREMAKQVAHEIKNPLTPMKMYIQHLEKAIKQQPDRAAEISKKISLTLLEQVENLTQIADSFSNFAELPQSSNEKIEINSVVEKVHNLFRKRGDMDIVLSEPMDPIYVYADKNQLIRILNNLVKNAIESIPKNRKGKISMSLTSKENKAIICVEDNGEGIAEDMQEKIFQPKFTTKDSGSGLGLAIASNMIESMNGRLYFTSKEHVGTRFYIELDVIRQNFDENNKRITLD